jgi:subfamily B ATP-binding cassette protein MsbA
MVLAVATGAYGVLAGPLVRALFGGGGSDWLGRWGLEPGEGPLWVPLAVVTVALVKGVATHFQAVSQARFGQRVVTLARVNAHRALLRGNPVELPAKGAGDLASRLLDDAERLEALVTTGLLGGIRDALQVSILVGLCIALDPAMTLLFFGAYPAALVPLAAMGRRVRRAAGTAAAERGALANEVHQQLHRFPLLVANGAERWAGQRVERASMALSTAVLRGVRLRATVSPLMEVLGAVALAFTVVYAQKRLEAGTLAPETVSSFLAATLLLYQPVKNLTRLQEVLAPGRVALERLSALGEIAAAPSVDDGGSGPYETKGPVVIEVEGLTVLRDGVRGPALRLPSARFLPGRLTVVVGPNGAGKSTLCAVLLGWVRPSSGTVTLSGVGLPDNAGGERRPGIGWVPTATLLAAGTLRENVALGRHLPDEGAWADLARASGVEALLARLPAGWETRLADGGEGLSSGEQRHVALARALFGAPDVLLLDEPEASLDDEAVAALAERLVRLKAGRTIVIMTHDDRLAAVADEIVRLEVPTPSSEPR